MKARLWSKLLLGTLVALLTLGAARGVAFAADSVRGEESVNTITAFPPDTCGRCALGKVTAIHGETLTVENRRGTFEILTDENTIFRVPGIESPTIKDIEEGDIVAGRVAKQEDGTFLAKAVAFVPPRPSRVRGLGKVIAVAEDSLTVENRQGEFTLLVDDETAFRIPGVEDPGIDDVNEGDIVAGRVVKQEDGTLLAKVVAVVPPRWIKRSLGRVTEIHGNKLVIETRRGTFDVHTDKDTVFRIPGVEDPGIDDVNEGDIVAGRVVKQEGNKLLAKVVAVIWPAPGGGS